MKRLRIAAVSALCLLVTCDRAERLTGPQASISDGLHESGNRNFFFLPPLVPDPSGSRYFDPLGFDATIRPAVHICRLDGTFCAPSQPSGFPLVYTMETGPDGQTVQLQESAQQFTLRWHAGDFHLDDASNYRITVLAQDAPLGHADVDVVSNGRELRSINTNQFIGLIDGRTLLIKFRIERGAVTAIDIAEAIVVGDQPNVLAPVQVTVQEPIAVTDAVALLPASFVDVREEIVVSDQLHVLPPAAVEILETIAVADQLRVLPPAVVSIGETVTVTDAHKVLPPTVVSILEPVSVTDQTRVLPPISISINETIVVTDAVAVTQP